MSKRRAAHQDARHEARRIMEQIVAVLHDGEHLGAPRRADGQVVIPIESPSYSGDAEAESIRALLAAWLDAPPRTE